MAGHRYRKYSRAIKRVIISPSDSTIYSPPLVAVEVFGAGDVAFVDDTNEALTITFPAAGEYPTMFEINARQVLATGTTVTDDLVGVRE